jgi:hypothetical protein
VSLLRENIILRFFFLSFFFEVSSRLLVFQDDDGDFFYYAMLCFKRLKDSDLSELKHKEHHSRQRWEWLEELGEREEKKGKMRSFSRKFQHRSNRVFSCIRAIFSVVLLSR